jgi:hypothetical protein
VVVDGVVAEGVASTVDVGVDVDVAVVDDVECSKDDVVTLAGGAGRLAGTSSVVPQPTNTSAIVSVHSFQAMPSPSPLSTR